MLIFDLETDGLLDAVTKIHVLVMHDTKSGITSVYNSQKGDIEEGVRRLMLGDIVCGHNVIKYDIPVLHKLYPWFGINNQNVLDTLVMSRLIYPDLSTIDLKLMDKGQLARKNYKSHSLEAWGQRLKEHKGYYMGDTSIADEAERKKTKWLRWNQDMEDYCVQDIVVTTKLHEKLMSKEPSELSVWLEHQVAWVVARQERHGFLFDTEKASKLYAKLVKRKHVIEQEIRSSFDPLYQRTGKLVPKRDDKKRGYMAGAPITKVELVQFNPGSRDHIAKVLQYRRGWEPTEFTDGGKPQIDEVVLGKLPYPEAKPLTEYFLVSKRIAQIAEGDEAWLKRVNSKTSRLHGAVITNGAVTGRMTHSKPNLAQVPAGYSPYGHECRECFHVPVGKLQVGIDASALELRDFAGYLAAYDKGAYILTVTKGRKEDGTEIHTVNRKALGIESRDVAKTWFYAFLYGAGDEKLGVILGYKPGDKARKAGRASRMKFLKNLPALGKLVKRVQEKVKEVGFLKGLDGRILHVRSSHSALNTLFQSAGAVQMKMALVILDRNLQAAGFIPGINYEFVANVHDEWQIECDKEIAHEVGKMGVEAIRQAGIELGFKCPLDGEYKVGINWAETH